MLTVQKLYTWEFLRVLATLAFGIALIFSVMGLIDKVDDFMPHRPEARLLLLYTLLTIPRYLHYLLPMATLLASLFVFSQAVGRREIVIIKASSGKMRSVLMPFVWIGVAMTFLGFFLGEVVVPATAKKAHAVRNRIMKKSGDFAFKGGTLYMRGRDGSIVRIALYLPDRNLSKGVTIFKFSNGSLSEKIDAGTGEWKDSEWRLRNVTVHDIASGKSTDLPEIVYTGIESPRIFREDMWKVEEMNLGELIQYQRRLKEAGFRNIKLVVDIGSRLSYPIINLFLLLLGISLSLGGDLVQKISHAVARGKAEGAGSGVVAAGLGLLISVIYWLGYSFFLSMGYAGAIPPLVAPWIVPLIFAGISGYLYSQIPE